MRIPALFLTLCAIVWIASIVPSEYVRLKHRSIIDAIQQQEEVERSRVEAAIKDYQTFSAYNFCHGNFYKDLTTLYMTRFAQQESENTFEQVDETLSAAVITIGKHLHCQPKDGNSWLIKAIIHVQHAGFNSDALHAYKQSAHVAPREAWLAERRSLFVIGFTSLLDEPARAIAINDIKVLQNASTNRQRKFKKALGVESLDMILEEMEKESTAPIHY
ncbi:MAG: hypothetical protein P8P30_05155 [Rickettsiales bacterium]|nr:hypothetical protein [Rickettsiales bacterium]